MIVRHKDTGIVLERGDEIHDFRGETHVFRMVLKTPEECPPDGIVLTNHGKYFPIVFGIEIVEEETE